MYFNYKTKDNIMQIGGGIMIISVVGKSGSGKSYISSYLSEMNQDIIHLNIDEVGHLALMDDAVKQCLVESFGEEVVKENNVDRKYLGDLVFTERKQMEKLTNITWSYMENYIDTFLDKNKDKIVILDWLLLPKTKFFQKSDLKIFVDAPLTVRMSRAIKRDGITKEGFLLRESASIDFVKEQFDYVITNDKTLEEYRKKVRKVYDKSIISRKF